MKRTTLVVAAVVTALATTLTGCADSGPGPDNGPNLSAPVVTGGPVTAIAPLPAANPTEIRIDAINASSSLVALGLNKDRTIAIPPVSQPGQASWYKFGPAPGAIGPAVILGHINGNGKQGVFARLNQLKPGDQVKVTRADNKTAVFTVTKLQQVPKAQFPTQQIYGDTPDAQLRLISCTGVFDKGKRSYQDNIVVFATLTSVA
jgi:LPXTG-site transpeptidase (sortase) family protein